MKNILIVVLLLVVAVLLYNGIIKDDIQPAIEAKGTAVESQINGVVTNK